MKIIFMGSPDFSTHILERLMEEGHDITLVVTQPDRAKGRGSRQGTPSDVGRYAEKNNLPTIKPQRIRDEEPINFIKNTEADIIVAAAFGQIIPKEILEYPGFGCVNVHASLLPKYRGASPIQQAILDGEKETGVSIMQMDEGLDTGDIISQQTVGIADDETGGSLFEKLAEEGATLLSRTLRQIEKGSAKRTPQGESPTPLTKQIKKSAGRIDFSKSAKEIERLVRAYDPWPCGYTFLGKKTLKIFKCEVLEGQTQTTPGRVIRSDDRLYVGCGEGALSITRLQLEGKKRMAIDDFLRGRKVPLGTVLGDVTDG